MERGLYQVVVVADAQSFPSCRLNDPPALRRDLGHFALAHYVPGLLSRLGNQLQRPDDQLDRALDAGMVIALAERR
jgi:hypothetical protein